MLWRKKTEPMPHRDVQAETVLSIMQGASVLPSKRFVDAVYTALLDHREMTPDTLEQFANRLSRLAWERGRK